MAINRPALSFMLSFNADPNDTSAVPLWTDATSAVRKISENRRGRYYELAQSIAAQPAITWKDVSESLNPANTGSPYYPDVQPYRAALGQGQYPAEPSGGAVNLINSQRWKPNDEPAPDPSFESYANGEAMPAWLGEYGDNGGPGDITPTITTSNPFQGTKSLTWATAAVADRQGVYWRADCIPGQQYTSSVYVRQTTASTQRLSVTGQTLGWDRWRRTSVSGLGNADSGQAWTAAGGGAAADYTIADDEAHISVTVTGTARLATIDVGTPDVCIQAPITGTSLAVGGGTQQGLVARYTDTSNHYRGIINIATSGAVTLTIVRRVAGVNTTLGTASIGVFAGTDVMLKLETDGEVIRAKAWNASLPEPFAWSLTVTDASLTTGNRAGLIAVRNASNTSPTVFTWGALYVVGNSSATTTTTGAYVRLSVTFTATQPTHRIEMTTIGTALAGTVNIDAIQHEAGASASAFTTLGPVIFPLLRNFAERFPRQWEAQGFAGLTTTPAPDAFAALNAITLDSDLVEKAMETAPLYAWLLNDGAGTVNALETSGNNGAPLNVTESKYGAGTAPEFGASFTLEDHLIAMGLGAAGQPGVRFTPVSTGEGPDTILSLGRRGTTGITFPRAYTTTWGATIACLIQINSNETGGLVIGRIAEPRGGTRTIPISLRYSSVADPDAAEVEAVIQSESGTEVSASIFLPTPATYLLVGRVTQVSGGDTTVDLFTDSSSPVDTNTVLTSTLGGNLSAQATVLDVGGDIDGGQNVDGVMSNLFLWDRALSADEIGSIYIGALGYPTEQTGVRLERYFTTAPYAGARRISDTCTTTLQPSTAAVPLGLLTAAQGLALAEAGNIWAAPDGAVCFESRQDRWLRLTSLATFGEDYAGGEIPYQDGIVFDDDPTYVYANVRITRNNGAIARGGTAGDIATAKRKYFGRDYAIGADFETDVQAQYYADYAFNTHKAPLVRVAALTVDLSAQVDLYPKVMCLEVGQRVTVKRRAKAANAGAGIVMSADYFIESVIIHEIDFDRQVWRVSFLLSPIGAAPGVTLQPWILEDATYGVLDSTTNLGW